MLKLVVSLIVLLLMVNYISLIKIILGVVTYSIIHKLNYFLCYGLLFSSRIFIMSIRHNFSSVNFYYVVVERLRLSTGLIWPLS